MDKITNLAIIQLIEYKTTGKRDHLTKAQQLIKLLEGAL